MIFFFTFQLIQCAYVLCGYLFSNFKISCKHGFYNSYQGFVTSYMHSVPNKGAYTLEFTPENNVNPLTSKLQRDCESEVLHHATKDTGIKWPMRGPVVFSEIQFRFLLDCRSTAVFITSKPFLCIAYCQTLHCVGSLTLKTLKNSNSSWIGLNAQTTY